MPLAFDLADEYRTPVMVIADGILGQMMEPVVLEKKTSRELPCKKDWALTGADNRKQHIIKSLILRNRGLEEHNLKLKEKYDRIEEKEVLCEQYSIEDSDIVLIAFGVVARIVRSAVNLARQEGIKAGWIRPVTLWPFPTKQIAEAADDMKIFLTLEMNNGQMVDDVKLAVNGKSPVLFKGWPGGAVPTIEEVLELIKQMTVKPKS